MKKVRSTLLCIALLAGCMPHKAQFIINWFNLFDTVTNVTTFVDSHDGFQ